MVSPTQQGKVGGVDISDIKAQAKAQVAAQSSDQAKTADNATAKAQEQVNKLATGINVNAKEPFLGTVETNARQALGGEGFSWFL